MYNQYLETRAILASNNEIIPLWNPDVKYIEDDDFGNHYQYIIKGHTEKCYETIDCVYDTATKEFSMGNILEGIKNYDDDFCVGTEIFYECSYGTLSKNLISKIEFELSERRYKRGREFDNPLKSSLSEETKNIPIIDEILYTIELYRPKYILDDGTEIRHTSKLFKLKK